MDEKVPYYLKPISLKPSSELIPDEYKISRQFLVLIIYDKRFEHDANIFAGTLGKKCQFPVTKVQFSDIKSFFSELKIFETKLNNSTNGIFIIILCEGLETEPGKLFSDKDNQGIEFSRVWQQFINLDQLSRKPKLFLFQSHIIQPKRSYEADGGEVGLRNRRLYDVPAPGADLLLIARTVNIYETLRNDCFITNFCDHIEESGKFADIIEIATFSTKVQRPLIVSTLTARCFMIHADFRDNNHHILKNLKSLTNDCKNVNAI